MVEPRIVSALVTVPAFATVPVVRMPTQLPEGLLLVMFTTIVRSFEEGMLLPSIATAVYTAPSVTAVEDVSVSVTSSIRVLDPIVKRVADAVAFRR
jgi:hypothetical protein